MASRLVTVALALAVLAPVFDPGARAATPGAVGQWRGEIGRSGLRRFYSTGGDLGELVNRQLSYELASRTNSVSSDVASRVLQWDTLYAVAPGPRSYVGFGLAFEHTAADIKFVEGTTDGTVVGPRIDAGVVLSDTLALGVRLEQLRFAGDNRVSMPTPAARSCGCRSSPAAEEA